MGDADGDGTVTFSDFLILSGNFGQSGVGPSLGDFNCDGEVGFRDFLILAANFGQTVASATVSVPEPTQCSMFSMLSVLLWLRPNRRTAYQLAKFC